MTESTLPINDTLSIPASELSFRASRSGGPGGQHVNTSSTRIELVWDVDASPSLDQGQRERIRQKLANRINTAGVLTLAGSTSRSQARNREEVTARFVELLREALVQRKPRRKTKPPRAAHENRLAAKRRRSETKKLRGNPLAE
jgi:ribosome-associated protein